LAFYPNLLSPLQARILHTISAQLPGVFLSGGTALGAFYLGHRRSADLDLFTREAGEYDTRVQQFLRLLESEALPTAAGAAGPGFRRFVVADGHETVPVDLVLDIADPIAPPTITPDGLAVDSLDDITANKLCAILGKNESRDYVDLFFLARAGKDPLTFLPAARKKDAGLDPAVLAFVMSEARIHAVPRDLALPLDPQELQTFVDGLRHRLARQAFPKK
jgi:hypothetical protein